MADSIVALPEHLMIVYGPATLGPCVDFTFLGFEDDSFQFTISTKVPENRETTTRFLITGVLSDHRVTELFRCHGYFNIVKQEGWLDIQQK